MDREEFYKDGNKVLTDVEYEDIIGVYDNAENVCYDVTSNIREAIERVMNLLWSKRSSTELVTEDFTIINRFGEIGIIEHSDVMDGGGEISLDDIVSVDKLMDILASIV